MNEKYEYKTVEKYFSGDNPDYERDNWLTEQSDEGWQLAEFITCYSRECKVILKRKINE